jgi:Domain of unknown function (DUF4124)
VLKRTLIGLLLTAAGILFHSTARADIFRCVGAGGTTMFTDLPCPSGMRTTDTITSAKDCGGAGCGHSVERDDEVLDRRAAEREQLAIREEERRRIEQDLAAREDALRRAEQDLAIREEESQRRAEEDARLKALALGGDIAPVEPYQPLVSYPVVVVPWWPCVGPRCFPAPHHRPHKPGDPQHHDPHPGARGPHDQHVTQGRGDDGDGGHSSLPPRGHGRQFARQGS